MATAKPTGIIGSKEFVEFPELNLKSVPAKVDTGADSSAIWATSAQVTTSGLQFTLFEPSSQFFTGEVLTTTDFRITLVKNSFGASEQRYKVRLLVRVGTRRIRAWFTLSDRRNMRYPVLLGRRLLASKFMVDVSRTTTKGASGKDKRVVILSRSVDRGLDGLVKDVAAQMHTKAQLVAAPFEALRFFIQTGSVRISMPDAVDLAEADIVYFKDHEAAPAVAAAAARYLTYRHVPYFDRALGTSETLDKLSELMLLATHGLSVAPTFCVGTAQLYDEAPGIIEQWGLPLVCKEVAATRGHKNYLVREAADLAPILHEAEPSDVYMLQRYIPNNGYLRLLVLGHSIPFGIQRIPVAHDDPRKAHLNNPVGGANASLVSPDELPPRACELALRAAELLQRQVAGVDIMQDIQTKEWYILEVNHAPQLISGAFPEEKRKALAHFFDTELSR